MCKKAMKGTGEKGGRAKKEGKDGKKVREGEEKKRVGRERGRK